MKKLLLIALLFFILWPTTQAFASSIIANHAFNTPERMAKDKQTLVRYLTKPYHDDYDKLQAIAYWIASHIAYDGYIYNNGVINYKELNYKYDVWKARTGICEDFARLFAELAQMAGIDNVEFVTGYVLENQNTIKRSYRRNSIKGTAHAWNKVKLGKRQFFVDTTFMANGFIGEQRMRRVVSFKHKMEIKKRTGHNNVNTNVNDFFIDFTPKQELQKYHSIHLLDKYIRN